MSARDAGPVAAMVPNESPAGHYGGWVMSCKRGGRLAHVLIRHLLTPNLCVLGNGRRIPCTFRPMLIRFMVSRRAKTPRDRGWFASWCPRCALDAWLRRMTHRRNGPVNTDADQSCMRSGASVRWSGSGVSPIAPSGNRDAFSRFPPLCGTATMPTSERRRSSMIMDVLELTNSLVFRC